MRTISDTTGRRVITESAQFPALARVLVTGASGFIGRHVCHALALRGVDVVALDRVLPVVGTLASKDPAVTASASASASASALTPMGTIDPVQCDLFDDQACIDLLDRYAHAGRTITHCVHLAWIATPGAYLESPDNLSWLTRTLALPALLARHGCTRFVGAGTCLEYDTSVGYMQEGTTPLAPRTLYGISKHACHLLTAKLCEKSGLSHAWLRFFFLFGPGEKRGRLVSDVMATLVAGEEAAASEGTQVRDFLHIEDAARAVACVALSELAGPVNIGSGEPVTVRRVVAAIAHAVGPSSRVAYGRLAQRPGDPAFLCADPAKLAATGFVRQFSLESGIADMLARTYTAEKNDAES